MSFLLLAIVGTIVKRTLNGAAGPQALLTTQGVSEKPKILRARTQSNMLNKRTVDNKSAFMPITMAIKLPR